MQVIKELDQHGDIIFIDHKTNYKSILFKTYYVLEYAVTNYNVKFVLKTDDDAFINVEPLINQLHLLCMTEDCTNERIYMGRMAKESEVLLQPGHKWNNIVFHNHTGTDLPLAGLWVQSICICGGYHSMLPSTSPVMLHSI